MKDYLEEEFDYLERVLKNYYHLKRKEQRLLRDVLELEMKLEDERQGSGICYDRITGTYNNVDTPYICSLINSKASVEKEATEVHNEYKRMDQSNKIEDRLHVLNDKQKGDIYALCRKGMKITEYANELGISRQAVKDRYVLILKKMLKVE